MERSDPSQREKQPIEDFYDQEFQIFDREDPGRNEIKFKKEIQSMSNRDGQYGEESSTIKKNRQF